MGTVAFLRNYHIAKFLSKHFTSSHLITIKNTTIPLKDKIPNDFIEEYRVFNFDYRNLGNILSSPKSNIRNKTNENSTSWKVKVIRKLIDSFPTNILFGEGGLLYIINGTISGIKIIHTNDISHIYSSFRPISDHVIACNLKILFPSINWVADFRDLPVSKSAKHSLFSKFQWWFIKKLVSRANLVTTVSDGVTEGVKYAKSDAKTLRNGIYDLFKNKSIKKYTKFTLSYTGSLYPRLQKPEIIFQSISDILKEQKISKDRIQLIYAGKDAGIWNELVSKYFLEDISVIKNDISLSDSIMIQKKSHINIIFSWSEVNKKGVLTGKLYEYLTTGNPIFSFVNGDRDKEFENTFEKLNAGFVFYNNDINKISDTICKLYNQWNDQGKINFSYNDSELKKYSWDNRIKQLMNLIKDSK